MKIRPYTTFDKEAVLHLLQLNTPKYFDPSEQADLFKYLEEEVEDYFVLEIDNKIVGAGGINYFPEEKTARIAWDMVRPDTQGKGYGKKLTEHRLGHINSQSEIELIVVRTTQLAHKFYAKMNFELVKIVKDFWAEGFDLYLMEQSNKT